MQLRCLRLKNCLSIGVRVGKFCRPHYFLFALIAADADWILTAKNRGKSAIKNILEF